MFSAHTAAAVSALSISRPLSKAVVFYSKEVAAFAGIRWLAILKGLGHESPNMALIDSEIYLLTCMRYIELNPVRANMVAHPSDYPWSSYHSNAQGQTNKLVIDANTRCAPLEGA